MPRMIYLIEGEPFPSMAKGFVVSRNKAGSDCMWGTVADYERSPALPYLISEYNWDVAIAQASPIAKARGETLFVVRG